MANYYTQFSFTLEASSPDSAAKLKDMVENYVDEDERELCLDKLKVDDVTVWFSDYEGVSLEALATVIQQWLKDCEPEQSAGFSWANTCSKDRDDAFSGGAVFITASNIEWLCSYQWLEDQRTKHVEVN